jgi:hypothetical protein
MPAVITHAGRRLFFGCGVVEVPATDVEAVDVHCLSRIDMPESAVRPAPFPWTETLVTTAAREAPGLMKRKSFSVFDEPLVAKFSRLACFEWDA